MSDQPPDRRDQRGLGRYILAAVVAVYVILFAFMNSHRVSVDWVLFERNSRLIYVILVSAALGALGDRLLQRRSRKGRDS
ncbi:MAG TPA: hypothetical protein PKD59_05275 [Miltoncostaeaceae bacterium]|nr:hypothetical protein [Miltoncostaeaceae bacterium]